ncbi:hypothetical protein [Flavobacterium nackdongense]|uniref:Uncharacterized protein n=1 Tax=Flavobacterium nackdongense TaxID=2547394 RepID=A0A4P6YG02_9FLAO|nr:hypothetical protein [Flavobacterium nackdongense]QBN19470.1 hypothetical protein E1750_11895 [Flavobacterium nackdongense]
MIRYYFISLFLTLFNCFGQEVSEINKVLEIPDTLEFQKEIRIYKDYSISNTVEIFRMYDEGKNNWKVTIYYYSKNLKQVTKINQIQFPKENIGKLKPKDANLIWLNLLLLDLEFLPDLKEINYKLKLSSIKFEDGEYVTIKNIKTVVDGDSYEVFIKNGSIENSFSFNNPETYLKYYPNVDELISYNQLLSTIKKEFNLWND